MLAEYPNHSTKSNRAGELTQSGQAAVTRFMMKNGAQLMTNAKNTTPSTCKEKSAGGL